MLGIDTIKTDNPHFTGEIRFIKIVEAQRIDFRNFGYTLYLEVGCTGNKYRAGYNYNPERKAWELGCN